MECKPKEIRFRLEQKRYVDIVMSEETGYDMPQTVQEILDFDTRLNNHPLEFVDLREQEWMNSEIIISDLEFVAE